MDFMKTRAVAKKFGLKYYDLASLLRNERVPAPAKDSSGDYCWLPADVERLREFLATRKKRKKRQRQMATA